MPLQAVLFPLSDFNLASAKKYMNTHHFDYIKTHKTENYIRFRVLPPKEGDFYSYKLTSGIIYIYEN